MTVLKIFLFGSVRIGYSTEISEIKLTRTSQALLAYLLLHRHRNHPREILASLFWADYSEERARSCLSTALWRLRVALELHSGPDEANLITASATEVGVNQQSHFWLDTQALEDQVDEVLAQSEQVATCSDVKIQDLKQVLQLYTGDLLEGFYDDWVLRERERLRSLFLSSLAFLMRYYHCQGACGQSLMYANQILQLDPLREEIHREVMRLHMENGQTSLALRHYQSLCKLLETELNILPMPETQALYQHIVLANSYPHTFLTPAVEPTNLQQALRQLQQARQNFDEAQKKLQQAIELVDQLTTTHFLGKWDSEEMGL